MLQGDEMASCIGPAPLAQSFLARPLLTITTAGPGPGPQALPRLPRLPRCAPLHCSLPPAAGPGQEPALRFGELAGVCSSSPPPSMFVCLKTVFFLGLPHIFHLSSQPTAGEGRSLAAMRKAVSPRTGPSWWGRQAAASRKMPKNLPCFPWLPG